MGGKREGGRRVDLETAWGLFYEIQEALGNQELILCGSARRNKPTCGDLDIVAVYPWPMERELERLLGSARGGLYRGVQVDVLLAPIGSQGTALMHATGSSEENVRLRRKAKSLGLKLNQYGLWTVDNENLVHGMSEREIYSVLGEEYVAPENR